MFRRPFPILYVSDMETALDFYCEILGFRKTFQWPDGGPPLYCYIKLGDLGIGLASRESREATLGWPVPAGGEPRFELCIQADDAEEASKHLLGRGVTQLVPPTSMPWGRKMVYFLDPDGNPIHITSEDKQA